MSDERELTDKDIATLAADVKAAYDHWQDKKQASEFARNAETEALNKLNSAQKMFDKIVDEYRDQNRGSNWGRPKKPFAQAV